MNQTEEFTWLEKHAPLNVQKLVLKLWMNSLSHTDIVAQLLSKIEELEQDLDDCKNELVEEYPSL